MGDNLLDETVADDCSGISSAPLALYSSASDRVRSDEKYDYLYSEDEGFDIRPPSGTGHQVYVIQLQNQDKTAQNNA